MTGSSIRRVTRRGRYGTVTGEHGDQLDVAWDDGTTSTEPRAELRTPREDRDVVGSLLHAAELVEAGAAALQDALLGSVHLTAAGDELLSERWADVDQQATDLHSMLGVIGRQLQRVTRDAKTLSG